MPATIKIVAPIGLSFLPAEKNSLSEYLEPKAIRPSPIREPELRLWKLSAQAASSKFASVELFVFLVFLTASLVETLSCFDELSRLLECEAVWRVVTTALNVSG